MIRKLNLPFLEQTTPPPFYQSDIDDTKRRKLDEAFLGKDSLAYYLTEFDKIDKAGKLSPSFNWSAFLMTFAWLLYRKRFLDCFVYCVAGWSFIKLNIVIIVSIVDFLIIRHLNSNIHWWCRIGVGLVVWLFWAYQVGRWGNAYYYRQARREIADALALYPKDCNAQKQHLKQHGGTSWLGAMIALGIFGSILSIVALQFVPIWAIQKEQHIIYESYQIAHEAHKRVASIYDKTGQCPVNLPLSAHHQHSQMAVVDRIEYLTTDCAVVLTVGKVGYPVRYLNGQQLVLYRTQNGWRCVTSLNKKQTPKRCIG